MNALRSILYLVGFTIWMWIFIFVGIGLFAALARADEAIDVHLVNAVIDVESGRNPNAVGSSGEIGLMQLRPHLFPQYSREQLFDPIINVNLGAQHLQQMRRICGMKTLRPGYPYTWVVCYNNGPYRSPKYPELHPYYKKVMAAYERRQSGK